MKKAKKILTLVACAVLLVCISVGATLAYLVSNTDIVTNTFTVGNVSFDKELHGGLDEADVDEYGDMIYEKDEEGNVVTDEEGNPVPVERVTENTYKLVPDESYVKDPTIHIAANSEPAFIYVEVKNPIVDIEHETDETIAEQMDRLGWTLLGDAYPNVWYYKDIVHTMPEDATIDPDLAKSPVKLADITVFEGFRLKDGLPYETLSAYAGQKIEIKAYAIQASGFEASEDKTVEQVAWEAAGFQSIDAQKAAEEAEKNETTGDETTGA